MCCGHVEYIEEHVVDESSDVALTGRLEGHRF